MPGLLLQPDNTPLDFLPKAHESLSYHLLAIHPVTYHGISQKKSYCTDSNRGPPDPQSCVQEGVSRAGGDILSFNLRPEEPAYVRVSDSIAGAWVNLPALRPREFASTQPSETARPIRRLRLCTGES